jgi:hypothetical protein
LELSYSVRNWLYVPVYCEKCFDVWRLVIMQPLERNLAVLSDTYNSTFNTDINKFSSLPTLKCLVFSNNVFFFIVALLRHERLCKYTSTASLFRCRYAVVDIIKRNTSNIMGYEIYKISNYELISQNEKNCNHIGIPQKLVGFLSNMKSELDWQQWNYSD